MALNGNDGKELAMALKQYVRSEFEKLDGRMAMVEAKIESYILGRFQNDYDEDKLEND